MVLLLQRPLEGDGSHLPACDRRFRRVFRHAQLALDAASAGPRHVAGDAVDLRVVIGFDHDLVGAGHAEIGADAADLLGMRAARGRRAGGEGQDRAGSLHHGGRQRVRSPTT
ncbi:hypothetical protein D3C72_1894210 [compost metagenome]